MTFISHISLRWLLFLFYIVVCSSVSSPDSITQQLFVTWSGDSYPCANKELGVLQDDPPATCPNGTLKVTHYATNADNNWSGGSKRFNNSLPSTGYVIGFVELDVIGNLACHRLDQNETSNLLTVSISGDTVGTINITGTSDCTIVNPDFCPYCAYTYTFQFADFATLSGYNYKENATNVISITCETYPLCSLLTLSQINITLTALLNPDSSSSDRGILDNSESLKIMLIGIGVMSCCVLILFGLAIRFWRLSRARDNLPEGYYGSGGYGINSDYEEKQKLLNLFGLKNYDVMGVNPNYIPQEQTSIDEIGDTTSPGLNVSIPKQLSNSHEGFSVGTADNSLNPKNNFIWSINKQISINEIEIGKRIGRGSYGDVFMGKWHGTTVAVKKLPANMINGGEASEEEMKEWFSDFQREAAIMRSLRHPNILQLIATYLDPPDLCIVMEFMERGSLYNVLHDKSIKLGWSKIKVILMDAAKGMAYLHNSNPPVIHRDLKSHNLLVDINWKCKVCDFGLAKMKISATVTDMTSCGTPAWTAPEVLRNEKYTEKCDVYSFGIVLWECMTGKKPHENMPPFQVVFAVGNQGLRPQIMKTIPGEIANLIMDCWAEDPDVRPSFIEILDRLDMIEEEGESFKTTNNFHT